MMFSCIVCNCKDNLKDLDEWDINLDFFNKFLNNDQEGPFKICGECSNFKDRSCSEENCDYSWKERINYISAINLLETSTNWTIIPKDVRHIISSHAQPLQKYLSRLCEFCGKLFCDKHDKTCSSYRHYEYIMTCPECYKLI